MFQNLVWSLRRMIWKSRGGLIQFIVIARWEGSLKSFVGGGGRRGDGDAASTWSSKLPFGQKEYPFRIPFIEKYTAFTYLLRNTASLFLIITLGMKLMDNSTRELSRITRRNVNQSDRLHLFRSCL